MKVCKENLRHGHGLIHGQGHNHDIYSKNIFGKFIVRVEVTVMVIVLVWVMVRGIVMVTI